MLNANVQSASMNSFCTLDEAEAYLEGRLYTDAWIAAAGDDEKKEAALIHATRLLNTLVWQGVRTDPRQPLEFPRKGLSFLEESNTFLGLAETVDVSGGLGAWQIIPVASDSVPAAVKNATAELALALLTSDLQALTGTEGFSAIKVGAIVLHVKPEDRASWFVDPVKILIKRFLRSPRGSAVVDTVRMG